jgi:hypothetical protein
MGPSRTVQRQGIIRSSQKVTTNLVPWAPPQRTGHRQSATEVTFRRQLQPRPSPAVVSIAALPRARHHRHPSLGLCRPQATDDASSCLSSSLTLPFFFSFPSQSSASLSTYFASIVGSAA